MLHIHSMSLKICIGIYIYSYRSKKHSLIQVLLTAYKNCLLINKSYNVNIVRWLKSSYDDIIFTFVDFFTNHIQTL